MNQELRNMNIIQRFWMRDIADHAIFLRKDLTVEQAADAEKALRFHQHFEALDHQAQNTGIEFEQVLPMVKDFIRFQNEMLLSQLTRYMVANDYPAFRDHLVKESEYYLIMAGQNDAGLTDNRTLLYEMIFWLRQTVEHALFIMHWADPYEMTAVKQSEDFANALLGLLNKARLYVSMISTEAVPEIPYGIQLEPPPLSGAAVPAVMSLAQQALALVQGYKDHLLAIRPMIKQVETLGVLTTRFVDHQTREAQYFMAVLNYLMTSDIRVFETEYASMPFPEDYTNIYL